MRLGSKSLAAIFTAFFLFLLEEYFKHKKAVKQELFLPVFILLPGKWGKAPTSCQLSFHWYCWQSSPTSSQWMVGFSESLVDLFQLKHEPPRSIHGVCPNQCCSGCLGTNNLRGQRLPPECSVISYLFLLFFFLFLTMSYPICTPHLL